MGVRALQWMPVTAALVCVMLFAGPAPADVAVPSLQARVTDLTATLPAQTVAQLEQRLAGFERDKGAQIAVLMVPTVAPESIEQYAVRAFEQWKLGRKGVDDGVLLIIAKQDRKLRIEVGYGLEGALNDATAKRIISDDIVPHFKHGDFAAGVVAGVNRIIAVIDGEVLPAPESADRNPPESPDSGGFLFNPEWLFFGFLLFSLINVGLRALLGRLGAATVVGFLAAGIIWLVVSSVIAASIIGVFAFIFSLAGVSGGGSGGGRSSGGGSWSSGGGGFSGGGGRSGGGGASGGW